jgi:hypothetical protein
MPSNALLGQHRSRVIHVLGWPYSEFFDGQAKVLVFPRGPSQKGTFYVDLDESGKVVRWRDVLTYENFRKIRVGMTVQDIERLIGPALWKWQVAKDNQTIYNYPFDNSICQIFQIAILPTNVVAEVGFGYAPECESFGDS